MTTGRFLVGVMLATVALAPVVASAYVLRRRFLPRWDGALGRLVEIVLAMAIVLVVLQVLGVLHLYKTAPVVIALALVGALIVAVVRSAGVRPASPERPLAPPLLLGRVDAFVVAGIVAVLTASWLGRTADGLHHGIQTIDSLWYHMPDAARFVQSGFIGSVNYSEPTTAFFPANSPLLHGLGILLFGNDMLSPILNLGWLALALFAGWLIGRPFGASAASLGGVALVLATPGFVATQPGGAYTDTAGLALLLSAAAVMTNACARNEPLGLCPSAISALATGIALGTKFTMIGPAGALAVAALFLAPPKRRLRHLGIWVVAFTATASVWYLRNLVVTGNPLPSLGFFGLRTTTSALPSFSVAQVMFTRKLWGAYFFPGLNLSLGPAWIAICAFTGAGFVAGAFFVRTRVQRALAWVGVASFVAYLVTPQYLGTSRTNPIFFGVNIRYSSPALVLGLVLLPTVPALAARTRAWILVLAYGAVLTTTQLDGTIWPLELRKGRFAEPIHGLDAQLGVLAAGGILLASIAGVLARRAGHRRALSFALLGGGVALVIAGAFATEPYLDRRFTATPPAPKTFNWARDVEHARIAVYGDYLQLDYPLDGRDLSNTVQFIGIKGKHGSSRRPTDCAEWRRVLYAGRYDYIVVSDSAANEWTAGDPAVHRLPVSDALPDPFSGVTFHVSTYRVDGALSPGTCPS